MERALSEISLFQVKCSKTRGPNYHTLNFRCSINFQSVSSSTPSEALRRDYGRLVKLKILAFNYGNVDILQSRDPSRWWKIYLEIASIFDASQSTLTSQTSHDWWICLNTRPSSISFLVIFACSEWTSYWVKSSISLISSNIIDSKNYI